MPKAKLKFQKADAKKVKVAAKFSDVQLGEAATIGNIIVTEVNYRTGSQLVEFGRAIETVTGDEIFPDDAPKAEAKKK